MSLHKKKGRWYAAVYLGTKNGKQEYEWSEGYEKKSDAQLAELEIKKSVIESNHKVYDKSYFSYVADIWLETKKKTVAPTTFEGYKNCYDYYIKSEFKNAKIKDVEPMDINSFMAKLDYKPATIKKIMTTLKQIFDFAISMNCIRSNPCYNIKKPNVRISKKKTWSPAEINRFLSLEDVKESSCYTALLILFSTGMRPGEVCGLRWCDYDGECFSAQVGVDSHGNITELKNDKAHEDVYISNELIAHLKKLKIAHKTIYMEHGLKITKESFINCLEPDMRPMNPHYLYHMFTKLAKRNGFEVIRLYDARHSFGTNMMKSGVNPKMVADMMRHTTIRTTLDNYSHTDKEMYKDTIKMYNQKIL